MMKRTLSQKWILVLGLCAQDFYGASPKPSTCEKRLETQRSLFSVLASEDLQSGNKRFKSELLREKVVKINQQLTKALNERIQQNEFYVMPLIDEYVGEEIPWLRPFPNETPVVYEKDPEQRTHLKIHFQNGLAYNYKNELLDTRNSQKTILLNDELHKEPTENAMFVMDREGQFYLMNEMHIGKLHHSSPLAGFPLAGAGLFSFKNGKLVSFLDESGHYRPPRFITAQVLKRLEEEGVDLTAVSITLLAPPQLKPEPFAHWAELGIPSHLLKEAYWPQIPALENRISSLFE